MSIDPRTWLATAYDDLVAFRRELHAHPELGWAETRTTEAVERRLRAAGLHPRRFEAGSGLVCDIGRPPFVGLRADLDALALPDEKDVPYRSQVDGVAHACGHDVHTTIVLAAGLYLAGLAEQGWPGGVRLIFQPAEEVMPGGGQMVIENGELDGVQSVYAVHCDPRSPVGTLGLRTGPITAASDMVEVRIAGAGGHTARPHLTQDLVAALADIALRVPALLSRRVDARSGCLLVWGHIEAGAAANAIPRSGVLRGTFRALDNDVWLAAPDVVESLVREVAAPHSVAVDVIHHRGVPPVVNHADAVRLMTAAVTETLGPGSVLPTERSMGGEDFGWYLQEVPGALARLGVRSVDAVGPPGDLHQGTFDVDERCLVVGAHALVATVLRSATPAAASDSLDASA